MTVVQFRSDYIIIEVPYYITCMKLINIYIGSPSLIIAYIADIYRL